MLSLPRIACLRIPRFQVIVQQKTEPELRGKPFAVITGHGNYQEISICSKEAASSRVYPGMKVSEARAVCADLLIRPYDNSLYLLAQKELIEKLVYCSPKVSALDMGTFLLDASGLNHLGGEPGLCKRIQKIANQSGFASLRTGVAGSAFAAGIACRFKRGQHFIVPPGQDKAFLAPMSVQYLPSELELTESFLSLGINSLGHLAAMPVSQIEERFGRNGVKAHELACGIDNTFPCIPQTEKSFSCSVDLGFALSLWNEVQFVIKSICDRLSADLKREGLAAEELHISFYNDNDKFNERIIKLVRPSNNAKFLLDLIKLSLDAKGLERELTALELKAVRFTPEQWQQNKTNQANDISSGDSLNLLMQKFISRLGPRSLVRPAVNDQHLMDQSGLWLPLSDQRAEDMVLPININYVSAHATPSAMAAGLVLRRSLLEDPVMVKLEGEMPSAITYGGQWHQIVELSEPEKLSGLWWESPVDKSYYVALIKAADKDNVRSVGFGNGLNSYLVLLVHDHNANTWYLEGFFD